MRRLWVVLCLCFTAACLGTGGHSGSVPVTIQADGRVVLEGNPYSLEAQGERLAVLRFLEAWGRDRPQEELLVWARPGAPGKVLLAFTGMLERAGVEVYRIAKGETPPRPMGIEDLASGAR